MMMNGLTRREHFWVLGLVAAFFVAVGIGQMRDRRAQQVPALSGPVTIFEDGELPGASEPADSVSGAAETPALQGLTDGLVDINVADEALLADALPGIGPAKARAIVEERQRNGPFASIDDLARVHGIGEKTVERLRPLVLVEGGPIAMNARSNAQSPQHFPAATPAARWPPVGGSASSEATGPGININTATMEQLQGLNGIGEVYARRIVEDREANGPFRSAADLQRVKGIGPKTVERNLELIRVH